MLRASFAVSGSWIKLDAPASGCSLAANAEGLRARPLAEW